MQTETLITVIEESKKEIIAGQEKMTLYLNNISTEQEILGEDQKEILASQKEATSSLETSGVARSESWD